MYLTRRLSRLIAIAGPRLRRTVGRELRLARWELARRRRKTLTVDTAQGRFTVDSHDRGLGRDLYIRREHELETIRSIAATLRERGMLPPRGLGTVLDLGANVGVISIGLLHLGEMARAVAVEPEPRNFELLRRNVAANGLEARFRCIERAVSDRRSEVRLELSDRNSGDHRVRPLGAEGAESAGSENGRTTVVVAADNLDALLAELPEAERRPDLVWIDVQGYEPAVLCGGAKTFADGVPTVMEVWPYGLRYAGFAAEDLHELARHYWSRYWVLRGGRLVGYPIAALDSYLDELGDGGAFGNVLLTR